MQPKAKVRPVAPSPLVQILTLAAGWAQIILLTTSLDRSSVIKKFTIDSANVLVRPIRTHSLYDMIRPVSSTTPAVATNVARLAKVGKQFDNTLGETSPLKILLVDDNRVSQLAMLGDSSAFRSFA